MNLGESKVGNLLQGHPSDTVHIGEHYLASHGITSSQDAVALDDLSDHLIYQWSFLLFLKFLGPNLDKRRAILFKLLKKLAKNIMGLFNRLEDFILSGHVFAESLLLLLLHLVEVDVLFTERRGMLGLELLQYVYDFLRFLVLVLDELLLKIDRAFLLA